MTSRQKSLVRYWVTGFAVLAVAFSLWNHQHFRLFLVLAGIVVLIIDKTMRPPRPEGVPTPLQIIENDPTWKSFVILFGIAALALAVLAVVIRDLGSWVSRNEWLILLILVPIAGPLVQSEIANYRAHGGTEP